MFYCLLLRFWLLYLYYWEAGVGGSFKRLKTPQKRSTHILNFRQ